MCAYILVACRSYKCMCGVLLIFLDFSFPLLLCLALCPKFVVLLFFSYSCDYCRLTILGFFLRLIFFVIFISLPVVWATLQGSLFKTIMQGAFHGSFVECVCVCVCVYLLFFCAKKIKPCILFVDAPFLGNETPLQLRLGSGG